MYIHIGRVKNVCRCTNSNAGQSNEKCQEIGSEWFRTSTATSLSKEHYVREHLVLTHSLYRGGEEEEVEGGGRGGKRRPREGEKEEVEGGRKGGDEERKKRGERRGTGGKQTGAKWTGSRLYSEVSWFQGSG